MGLLRDIFEDKRKVWEGADTSFYAKACEALKNSGMKIQAFKVAAKVKCEGHCLGCKAGCKEFDEDTPFYKKIGSGISTNLIEENEVDIYDIFVKKSDESRALELLRALAAES